MAASHAVIGVMVLLLLLGVALLAWGIYEYRKFKRGGEVEKDKTSAIIMIIAGVFIIPIAIGGFWASHARNESKEKVPATETAMTEAA